MVNTQRNSPSSPTPASSPSRPENHVTRGELQAAEHDTETLPEIVEASVKGRDEPMEREHPKAPGALIWFSYPLALLIVLAIIVVVFMLLNNNG